VRPDRRVRRTLGIAGAAIGCAAVVSCLGATQIELHVTTDAPCKDPSQWKGVSIYVGATTDIETKAPTLTTSTCDDNGQVGSLVVVPSGSNSDEIGIRVVAGVTRAPEECAANQYEGCIVARRAIRFNPHHSLDLDIALTRDCIGISCDPTHTCVNQVCVDSQEVSPPADGGAGGPTVRCGDNGIRCPTTGDVCCLTVDVDAGTTSGECRAPTSCPTGSLVLNCDKESDCVGPPDDAGRPNVCCLAYKWADGADPHIPANISGSQCLPLETCTRHGFWGDDLCSDRQACVDGKVQCHVSVTIPAGLLPGYFWCDL
jgi:hypothetical protein